jgi:ribosomal protein S18 acetylase RimI-like enzyme
MAIQLASVDKSQIYRAFMEAFADYAMDASGTKEESMLLRMSKNSVDFQASVGAYIVDTGNTRSTYIVDTGNTRSTYDDKRLVGFTLIGIDKIDSMLTAYDAGTGIVPDFRGQGLAKRMFDHALPEMKARGVKRFLLEVLQSNEPAIKAYQKSGFEIARELKCYVAETTLLMKLTNSPGIVVRPIDAATFEELVSEADWTPSFENRFTAHLAIPDHVTFIGAFDEDECIGSIAYCSELNWLLSLLVKRSHRRRGVGKVLLKHLAATMPEAATKLPALNIDGDDKGMQAFFGTIGFSHLIDQYEMSRGL